MNCFLLQLSITVMVFVPSLGFSTGPLSLLDVRSQDELRRIVTSDAKVALVGGLLEVSTGNRQAWPGFTLRAPQPGQWDLSEFSQLAVRIRNTDAEGLTIFCRVDNPGADGTTNCVTGSVNVAPGKESLLMVPLKRTSNDQLDGVLFGMRGYPVKSGGSGTLRPESVSQLLVFLHEPSREHKFQVLSVEATGRYVTPTAWSTDANPFLPFIDTYGQYRHKAWPGKIAGEADWGDRRSAEERDLIANPEPREWDRYGGWAAGPRLQATGFFRTEKIYGKWWLVDPDGRLFFSHGVDCAGMLDTTPVTERERWFEKFPGEEPEFARFKSRQYALKGHYAGTTPECFSFAGANLQRKYGTNWERDYPEVIHRRLRSWGLNTVANWSSASVVRLRKTPYTDTVNSHVGRVIEGSEGYWGKFPDVFDPGFKRGLEQTMEAKKRTSAADPWCIGYFSDNEMSWGDELSLGLAALRSPADQPAKQVLVYELKKSYATVELLNAKWSTSYTSWDDILAQRKAPEPEKARADFERFYTQCAEQYFRTVRAAIRQIAPKQLYLGCRFAWVNALAAGAAARFCDVVSYNLYQHSVAEFAFNGSGDVPLIIGEFHFGALDRGSFHTGLVPVESQAGRASAYRDYVIGALHHPQIVGCHWFQYQDEPTTGRVYDEENYQIGLVDIADNPYPETIQALREVASRLYRQ